MAEGRVRWGVLSAAKIAREWVVPGIHMSDRGELAAVASLTPGKAAALAAPYGEVTAPRQLRGAARRSRGRRHLHPAAEPPARGVDGEMPRSRQARALREADRAPGRGDRPADRAPRPHRARGGRGVHGHASSAVDPRPRAGAPRAPSAGSARCRAPSASSTTTPGNIRNRADMGGGALRDIGVYPSISTRFVSGEEPVAVPWAAIEWDARHRRHRAGGGGVPELRHGLLRLDAHGAAAGHDLPRRQGLAEPCMRPTTPAPTATR